MKKDSLLKLIDKYNIITFDVFDTLIIRDVLHPTDIFLFTEKSYEKKYQKKIDFFHNRIEAEKRCRLKLGREVNFYEIYDELDQIYDSKTLKILRELELATEFEFCRPNPEMRDAFKYAIEKQKDVFIISDMYMPKTSIERLLIKNDIKGFKKVYVSSEIFKTKRNGDMFAYFLQNEHAQANQCLHIGDSKRADVFMPIRHGMHAYWYRPQKREFDFLKMNRRILESGCETPSLQLFLNNFMLQNDKKKYAFKFGYAIFGPLLYGYSKWICDKCEENEIKSVIFLARDGYILKKCAELFNRNLNMRYLYISRKAVVVPLLHYDSTLKEMLDRYKSWPYQFSFGYFLDKMGLNPHDLEKNEGILDKIDFNKKYTKDQFVNNGNILECFELIKEKIKINSLQQDELLKEFLKQNDVLNNKIALVDLGGRRTIEKNLREYLSTKKIRITIYGLYLEIQDQMNNFVQAYLFDKNTNRKIYTIVPSFYYFLEIILSAPHGTTVAYCSDNNKIRPVLGPDDYQDDKKDKLIINELQEGALQFVRDFQNRGNMYFDFTPFVSLQNLFNFGIFPDKKAITEWGNFKFNADGLSKMIQRRGMLAYIMNPRLLISDYKSSMWKAGFITSLLHTNFFNWFILKIKLRLKYNYRLR